MSRSNSHGRSAFLILVLIAAPVCTGAAAAQPDTERRSSPRPDLAPLRGRPFPTKVFVPIPARPTNPADPDLWGYGTGMKHVAFAYDSTRKLTCVAGGDHGVSYVSQNRGFCFDSRTEVWSRWQNDCRPAGQIMPPTPDNMGLAYQKAGHRFWRITGPPHGLPEGGRRTCRSDRLVDDVEDGATEIYPGLFYFDIDADRWHLAASMVTSAHRIKFDNVRNELVYIESNASLCGYQFVQLDVGAVAADRAAAKRVTTFCNAAVVYPGDGRGNFETPHYVDRSDWALDEVGRHAYVISVVTAHASGREPGTRIRFHRFNLDTRTVERLPDPPNTNVGGYVADDSLYLAWDSVNKRVLYPFIRDFSGLLEGMYAYDPATKTWESFSTTPTAPVPGDIVRVNSGFYDPDANIFYMAGTNYDNAHPIRHIFKWRYGP